MTLDLWASLDRQFDEQIAGTTLADIPQPQPADVARKRDASPLPRADLGRPYGNQEL